MSELTLVKETEMEVEKADRNFKNDEKETQCKEPLPFVGQKFNFALLNDEKYSECSDFVNKGDEDTIGEVVYPILTLKSNTKAKLNSPSDTSVEIKAPKLKATDEVKAEYLAISREEDKRQSDEWLHKIESVDESVKGVADKDENSEQCIVYPTLKLKKKPKSKSDLSSEAASKIVLQESNIEQKIRTEMQSTQNNQKSHIAKSVRGDPHLVENLSSNVDHSVVPLEKLELIKGSKSLKTFCKPESLNEISLQKSNSLVDLKSLRLRNSRVSLTIENVKMATGCAETIKDLTGSCLALDVLQQLPTKYFLQQGFLSSNNNSESGIKFYSLLMLNTWRKQRLEVERMKQETEEVKQNCNNTRNQIYVLNNLYRIEMKCNMDMQAHLGVVVESIRENKGIAKSLTEQYDLRSVEKSVLEKNLQSKNIECQALNEVLTEIKNKLFGCNHSIEEFQTLIDEEQGKGAVLNSQLDDLVVDIADLKRKNKEKVNKIRKVITNRETAINEKKLKIETAKATSELLNEAHEEFGDYEAATAQWRLQVQELREKVVVLQNEIENNRLMNWVKNSLVNILDPETKVAQAIHIILYLLLPAVPPPRSIQFPYGFSVGKSLSFISHK
ncbi:probable E3 ubiquitin-protein ligase bre1 [Teleopsis dalmanni]|uniref:probable E3 ubiquitin-protein ligase bre1 n=1 Tax=Teleopsis dalmanni TaxID=139649 RepID=UPI0018CEA846|nr:probable E3 ubiquitin-protein ligase bre1 [Teleopsis dalmanni]